MRKGIFPTAIGAIVTAGAATMRARERKSRRNITLPMIETALVGFGIAHVVLGTIDMIRDRPRNKAY